eukprot:COSAG04_NODE_13593_length_599_cov_1.596000_1_plen_110_part_00
MQPLPLRLLSKPQDAAAQPALANPTGGCKPPCHNPGHTCCTPGAPLRTSSSLKNVLIFGDSVSIDYVGDVKQNLSDVALVQHAPWDVSDGGAGSTVRSPQLPLAAQADS